MARKGRLRPLTYSNRIMYAPELVAPMKSELAQAGFTEVATPDAVDAIINQPGTALVVLNSICGCAAATMRPGVRQSLNHSKLPSRLATAFAGVDTEAVERARKFMLPYPPSSPCVALFKDGQLVHMVERVHIQGRTAEMIADHLKSAYDEFC